MREVVKGLVGIALLAVVKWDAIAAFAAGVIDASDAIHVLR